jgi:transcriptional regulator with XRE-family HTH domain
MAIRIRQGEKRPALAKRCGITYQHLWGIEREHPRHSNPSIELLNRIANALEVPLGEVMEEESEPKEEDSRQQREPNPTTHPEPSRPEPPPTPRRRNDACAAESADVGVA